MTSPTSSITYGILLLTSLLAMGCASSYQAIQPLNLTFDNNRPLEGDTSVSIAYRYDVLQHSGNVSYNNLSLKWGFCVLAFRIENRSDNTLLFPENFAFYDTSGLVEPLRLAYASDRLVHTGSDENAGDYTGIGLIFSLPSIINAMSDAGSDEALLEEFKAYYLVNSTIFPHTSVTGLVAFKVKPGTYLTVKKR